jgi:hypothetical protein
MQISDLTFMGFLGLGGIRCLSYLPQIMRIIRDDSGASAISYTTWFTWILAHLATALYAAFNIGDSYLAIVSIIYAFFCTVVLLLTVFKRSQYRNRTRLLKGHEPRDGNQNLPSRCAQSSSVDSNARRFLDRSNALRSIEKGSVRAGFRA